jgi:hypothetical protein
MSLFQHTLDAIVIVNDDRIFVDANPAAAISGSRICNFRKIGAWPRTWTGNKKPKEYEKPHYRKTELSQKTNVF